MLIYGKQPVLYAIQHHKEDIEVVYIAKELDKKEYSALMREGFEVKRIPPNAAQSMVKGGNHQGYIAQMADLTFHPTSYLKAQSFIVVLSSITDVGNIGSIARSAYALGVEALVVCGIKDLNVEPIVRTSTGAILDLPLIVVHNIHDLLNELKQYGFTLYGAMMEGTDVRNVTFDAKKALILGSEGEGLSGRVQKRLDQGISIPMAHDFDSLNVGVAGAILMERMR